MSHEPSKKCKRGGMPKSINATGQNNSEDCFGSWLRENVLGAVAEPSEVDVNNAEQAQFDVLFIASLELILRPACIVVNVRIPCGEVSRYAWILPGAALRR
jgi:hypothetical protein